MRIKPGRIVETKDGKRGVTVPDFMGCCSNEETPVVFYGTNSFKGTNTEALTLIGPENPVATPELCGAGQGANCCIFLMVGPTGFSCERHTELRCALQIRKSQMVSQREPTEPYPNCQIKAPISEIPS